MSIKKKINKLIKRKSEHDKDFWDEELIEKDYEYRIICPNCKRYALCGYRDTEGMFYGYCDNCGFEFEEEPDDLVYGFDEYPFDDWKEDIY